MDFGAREILILLGVLVVVAILLDGIRRLSRSRRGKLRTSPRRSSRNAAIFDDDDDYPGELPGRGSRVVQVRDERSAEEVSAKIKRDCDYTRNKFTSPFKARGEKPAPDRDPAIFDDSMEEPVNGRDDGQIPAGEVEPAVDTDSEPLPSQVAAARQSAPFTATEDDGVPAERGGRERAEESRAAPLAERVEPPRQASDSRAEYRTPPGRPASPQDAFDSSKTAPDDNRGSGRAAASSGGASSAQQDILILHLMAHKGRSFEGEKLLEQLLDHGLRYGAMRIFHRHETLDGAGPVHFSVANSVNPGVFDLNLMDRFTTPGVTFIMPLDGLERPLESFETLINTAVSMCRKLDGELKDDTRSAFTKQTIEHYRQRIIDFTRRSFTLTN